MSLGHLVALNQHRLMLADRARMETYHAAIRARVRPGMRVLDLGTGTGILAMWAAQAGAQVIGIEPHDVIHLAERVAVANGLDGQIQYVQSDSQSLALDAPVDLVITECMGNFFISDEMAPALRDLRRHLGPGGETLPRAISLWVGAAALPLWNELRFWRSPIGGLDYSAAIDFAGQTTYVTSCAAEFLLGAPQEVVRFTLLEAPDTFELQISLAITQAWTLDALLGWFSADLADGITLSTAPGTQTHWGQTAFPVPATSVVAGDRVDARITLAMDEHLRCHYTWAGEIVRPGRPTVSFQRDTRQRFAGVRDSG